MQTCFLPQDKTAFNKFRLYLSNNTNGDKSDEQVIELTASSKGNGNSKSIRNLAQTWIHAIYAGNK